MSKNDIPRWAVVLVLTIVGLFCLLIVVYFLKPLSPPTPRPNLPAGKAGDDQPVAETPTTTVSWKIFKNEEFSFKYPSSWSEAETTLLSTRTSINISDGNESVDLPTRLEIISGSYYNQELNRFITLDEWTSKQNFPSESYTTEEIALEGWRGSRHTYHIHGIGYFNTVIALTDSAHSTSMLLISYRHSSSEYESKMPKTLDQILSTFEFIDEAQPSPTPTKSAGNSQRFVSEGCRVGGCSSELCVDGNSENVYSICIYNPVYECYKTARCERQENGECRWSQTEELKACLEEKSAI